MPTVADFVSHLRVSGANEVPLVKRAIARSGRGWMFRRRLPQELGGCLFPASLEGGAKYLRLNAHHIDAVLTEFARSAVRKASVVWDVGANVGLFSFVAAGLAGPAGTVVALEPDVWLASNLRRAAAWNRDAADVIVIAVAVADNMGLGHFAVAKNSRAASYLTAAGGSPVTGGVREYQYVPTVTLDHLACHLPRPDVLKVDVEGAEALVLAGGATVLEARPLIFVETVPRTQAAVHEMLSSYGYRYTDASTRQPCPMPVFNTIATPS